MANTLYRCAEAHHTTLVGMLVHLLAMRNELYKYDVRNGDEKLCDSPVAYEFYSTAYALLLLLLMSFMKWHGLIS